MFKVATTRAVGEVPPFIARKVTSSASAPTRKSSDVNWVALIREGFAEPSAHHMAATIGQGAARPAPKPKAIWC